MEFPVISVGFALTRRPHLSEVCPSPKSSYYLKFQFLFCCFLQMDPDSDTGCLNARSNLSYRESLYFETKMLKEHRAFSNFHRPRFFRKPSIILNNLKTESWIHRQFRHVHLTSDQVLPAGKTIPAIFNCIRSHQPVVSDSHPHDIEIICYDTDTKYCTIMTVDVPFERRSSKI